MGYVSRARRSGCEGETGATGNYGNTSPFLCFINVATSPQPFIIENVKSVAPKRLVPGKDWKHKLQQLFPLYTILHFAKKPSFPVTCGTLGIRCAIVSVNVDK
jgi:hypothetical protein